MIHRMPWFMEQSVCVSASVPTGFMMCPAALMAHWSDGVCPWQAIYEEAMARTQRALRPSKVERLYVCPMN